MESGYRTDKLKNIGFTTSGARCVNAPIIDQLALSLECEVVHAVTIGSHTQVTGEVKRIVADESILNGRDRVVLEKLQPLIYDEEEGVYHGIGTMIAPAFKTGAALMKSLEEQGQGQTG